MKYRIMVIFDTSISFNHVALTLIANLEAILFHQFNHCNRFVLANRLKVCSKCAPRIHRPLYLPELLGNRKSEYRGFLEGNRGGRHIKLIHQSLILID
jgi:hypothetical protein